MERSLDFDTVVDRRNTNSIKYDFAVERGMPPDILPLWVADMDFRISSYIQDAISEQANHGIYGYSETAQSYFQALQSWLEDSHGWRIKNEWLIKTPGVVFALAMTVKAFTKKGDGILIQRPVYYPFHEVIKSNQRKLVDSPLLCDDAGRYYIDTKDFEEKIVKEKVKLFFLCNPQNPTGRVWSAEELIEIGDICYRHKVVVVSDEIHADFVFEGKHHVFANLKPEYQAMTITCTAPSKTFNIAGLQISNIIIEDAKLRDSFQKEKAAVGYSQVNSVGIVACEAAYRNGRVWHQAVLAYIKDNITFLKAYLSDNIPQIRVREPEGTYLVWLDFSGLKLSASELRELIVAKAGLWLDEGEIFGPTGAGFQRVNVACPRLILEQALSQLKQALQ